MAKVGCLLTICLGFLIVAGCGPDTIFLRPGLDTPAQHVVNGRQLLQRGKLEDASREFKRAKELDPLFIQAYVGLGVALARMGDLAAATATMDQAMRIAGNSQEIEEVQKGYEQIETIRQHQSASPPQ